MYVYEMLKTYKLQFPVDPSPWSRARTSGKRFFTAPKMKQAQDQLKWLMKSQFKRFPFEGPIKIELIFTVTRPKSVSKSRIYPLVKPDLDNYVKQVCDSGIGILWKDDSLIVEIVARKEYGESGIELTISELG